MDGKTKKVLIKKWIVYGGYLFVLIGTLAAAILLTLPSSSSGDDIFGDSLTSFDIVLTILLFAPILAAEFDLFYYLQYVWIQKRPGDEKRNRINKISTRIALIVLLSLPISFFVLPVHFGELLLLLALIWALCYPIFRIITCVVWSQKD